MLIGVRKKFVFIANSKTASTSIESALSVFAEIRPIGSPAIKHMSWINVRKEYAFLFDQKAHKPETFFRFGVIREPASWIVSWFNYRSGNQRVLSRLPPGLSFEAFWGGTDWIKKKNQKGQFTDVDGKCRFDLIIPLEKLDMAFPIVTQCLLKRAVPLKKENISVRKLVSRDKLDPAIVDSINEYYREDYEFYLKWRSKSDDVLQGLSTSAMNID